MLLYHSQQSLYRGLCLLLGVFFLFLQYQLIFSEQGVQSYFALKDRIATQKVVNDELAKHNRLLAQEVKSLYRGGAAFDYHARMKYGLVGKGERYYPL